MPESSLTPIAFVSGRESKEAECFSSFLEPQAEWEEAEEAHPEEVEEVHLVVVAPRVAHLFCAQS